MTSRAEERTCSTTTARRWAAIAARIVLLAATLALTSKPGLLPSRVGVTRGNGRVTTHAGAARVPGIVSLRAANDATGNQAWR